MSVLFVNMEKWKSIMADTKTVLLRKQIFAVGDMIRKYCKLDEHGFAVYDDGWDDARILQCFISEFPITITNVLRLRRDLVGDMRRGSKSDTVEDIAMLRRRLFLLEQWATKRKHDAYKPEVVMPTK